MLYRLLTTMCVVLALGACLSRQVSAADEKAHEGLVVKAGGGKLTMTMKGEEKEHTMNVAKDAKITVDGKAAKLDDLKKGYHVKVMTHGEHGVVKIEAHSKAK